MKKLGTIVVLIISISLCSLSSAQQNCISEQHREIINKLIEAKEAYLKDKMQLSDKEAEKFFALYSEMEIKKFEINHKVYSQAAKIRKSEMPVSNDTYAKSAEEQASLPFKIAKLEHDYFLKFKNILSPQQLFMYYNWERKFGKDMIKKHQGGKEVQKKLNTDK